MPPKPQDKSTQDLSSKDQAQFRTVVSLYEQKQYKKAVKAADSILKTNPEHAATLAMKGLCLGSMDRKEEAFALVRESIRLNIRSSTCWHALGLLYRAELNNPEALKSYKMALKQDPGNPQLLRDLAILQMHLRQYKGLQETRRDLLGARSNVPAHWIGFAVSHHMTKNYTLALEILRAYEHSLPADRKPDIESNGLKFYCVQLLEESGNLAGALSLLETDEQWIINKSQLSIKRAELLTKLGRFEEAEPLWRAHLAVNPENYFFHRGLQCCLLKTALTGPPTGCDLPSTNLELTPAQVDLLLALYTELEAGAPKCRAHRRIPLSFLPAASPAFAARLDSYLRTSLRAGIPSVFSELTPLYKTSGKPEVLQTLILSYLEALRTSAALPPAVGTDPAAPQPSELPTTLLWSLLFAARHFDLLGDRTRALSLVEEGIVHTPTVCDLYMFKARILKHMGRLAAAADVMNFARTLDLADRYINSKSTKYKLRANRVEDGKATIALFARDSADAMQNLRDVQTVWFELECGDAYARLGNIAMALKNYLCVQKHFEEYFEGQYDYHGYCLRKMTLTSYTSFITFQDTLFGHPSYVRAVQGIVSCYLNLQKAREAAEEAKAKASAAAAAAGDDGADDADIDPKLSAAEKKKLKAQRRREKAKKEKEEAKKTEAATAAAGGATGSAAAAAAVVKDDDPDGAKLVAVESPVQEAQKHGQKLLSTGSTNPEGLSLLAEVALRRGKLLQAVRCVNKAAAVAPDHPTVFTMVANAAQAIGLVLSDSAAAAALHPAVHTLLQEFLTKYIGAGSVAEYAQGYLAKSGGDLAKCLAAAQIMGNVLPALRRPAVDAVLRCDVSPAQLAQCEAAVSVLEGWGEADAALVLRTKCKDVFPGSDAFDATAPEPTAVAVTSP